MQMVLHFAALLLQCTVAVAAHCILTEWVGTVLDLAMDVAMWMLAHALQWESSGYEVLIEKAV